MSTSSLLDSYLDFFYAKEILYRLPSVIKQTCQGCLWGSLSQTDHACVNLTKRQQLDLYFEDILRVIDEEDILVKWRETVTRLESPVYIALYELKVTCVDWRATMKTPVWRKRMIHMAVQLMRLERNF